MATHTLKTWPEPFAAVANGSKRFEFRAEDRDLPFTLGDWLHLCEWVPAIPEGPSLHGGYYTGRMITARVSFILRGKAFGVPEDYAVMSLAEITLYPRSEVAACAPA